jgi:hypothetical protein
VTTCHDVQQALEFADGELSGSERAEVNAHLSIAGVWRPAARPAADSPRRGVIGPIAPPDHVWLRSPSQARIERPTVDQPATRIARIPAMRRSGSALAAALVLVTVGAHYFLRSVPEDSGSSAPGSAAEILRQTNCRRTHTGHGATTTTP